MNTSTDTDLQKTYDSDFYSTQIEGSRRSAKIFIDIILKIFPDIHSAIDFGCGTGVWLSEFKNAGVETVCGLDGGAAHKTHLQIDPSEYISTDLTLPFEQDTKYDLAMSVEVAEHLPQESADNFIKSLCAASDLIIFGAAVPGQGGTHHINEQWASYWIALFEQEGYQHFDLFRDRVWYDSDVEWWYAQNTLVYVNGNRKDMIEKLIANSAGVYRAIDVIHPTCFEQSRREVENLIDRLKTANTQQTVPPAQRRKHTPNQIEKHIPEYKDTNTIDESDMARLLLPGSVLRQGDLSYFLKEKTSWRKIALRNPFNIARWMTLWRVQRRRAHMDVLKS